MSIAFKNNIFHLNTPNTSYIFGLYHGKMLMHLYYGKRLEKSIDMNKYIPVKLVRSWDSVSEGFQNVSDNSAPMEFPTFGSADMREPAVHIRHNDGSTVSKFEFVDCNILKGKPQLKGLPSSYIEDDDEADTLEIKLFDRLKKITLLLSYTVYNTCDIITKSVRVINTSQENCRIDRLYSSAFDMLNEDYELITLGGNWAYERQVERNSIIYGNISIDSKRGNSSHQHNPFMAIVDKNADEKQGKAYGFSIVYSGNFKAAAELDEGNLLRVMLGINDFNFGWNLAPNEEFQAPETILTFSDKGIGGMSRKFHKFIRTRICRGKWRDKRRPVLINNWEATYFDFNEEKILAIADKAKEAGVELLVLDDGWFGKRNDDTSSLGDWYVNKEKLPCGISQLAKKVNDKGLKFGLWFEPEMVSPDSKLYKKHPDWCLHIDGRYRSQGRNQLILDLSRDDVCDYITDILTENLKNANIEYVKWDMNRTMSEVGSAMLPPERQQEVYHRYILGLYKIFDIITKRFPDVLFEGCAGGGGRFDLGILCYFPQIWTSDDSDAIERLYIQYGTSLVYPVSTMGAHVSAVPNHQVHRVCSIKTRGDVAMTGAFGYELDLNMLSNQDFEAVKKQIEFNKRYSSIIQKSDLYRIKSPFESNECAFEFVSEDKTMVFILFANILSKPDNIMHHLRLEGIDDNALYTDEATGESYYGDFLKNVGLFIENNRGDFKTDFIALKKVEGVEI